MFASFYQILFLLYQYLTFHPNLLTFPHPHFIFARTGTGRQTFFNSLHPLHPLPKDWIGHPHPQPFPVAQLWLNRSNCDSIDPKDLEKILQKIQLWLNFHLIYLCSLVVRSFVVCYPASLFPFWLLNSSSLNLLHTPNIPLHVPPPLLATTVPFFVHDLSPAKQIPITNQQSNKHKQPLQQHHVLPL